MVLAKTKLFDDDLRLCARYFKALSHPARLSILQYLSTSKTCITGDISDYLPLSRTTVNQHLKELKNVGLIKGEVEGINTRYCLKKQELKRMKQLVQEYLHELSIENIENC